MATYADPSDRAVVANDDSRENQVRQAIASFRAKILPSLGGSPEASSVKPNKYSFVVLADDDDPSSFNIEQLETHIRKLKEVKKTSDFILIEVLRAYFLRKRRDAARGVDADTISIDGVPLTICLRDLFSSMSFWMSNDQPFISDKISKQRDKEAKNHCYWSENHSACYLSSVFLICCHSSSLLPQTNLQPKYFHFHPSKWDWIGDMSEDVPYKEQMVVFFSLLMYYYLKAKAEFGNLEYNSPVYIPYSLCSAMNILEFTPIEADSSFRQKTRNLLTELYVEIKLLARRFIIASLNQLAKFTSSNLSLLSVSGRSYSEFRKHINLNEKGGIISNFNISGLIGLIFNGVNGNAVVDGLPPRLSSCFLSTMSDAVLFGRDGILTSSELKRLNDALLLDGFEQYFMNTACISNADIVARVIFHPRTNDNAEMRVLQEAIIKREFLPIFLMSSGLYVHSKHYKTIHSFISSKGLRSHPHFTNLGYLDGLRTLASSKLISKQMINCFTDGADLSGTCGRVTKISRVGLVLASTSKHNSLSLDCDVRTETQNRPKRYQYGAQQVTWMLNLAGLSIWSQAGIPQIFSADCAKSTGSQDDDDKGSSISDVFHSLYNYLSGLGGGSTTAEACDHHKKKQASSLGGGLRETNFTTIIPEIAHDIGKFVVKYQLPAILRGIRGQIVTSIINYGVHLCLPSSRYFRQIMLVSCNAAGSHTDRLRAYSNSLSPNTWLCLERELGNDCCCFVAISSNDELEMIDGDDDRAVRSYDTGFSKCISHIYYRAVKFSAQRRTSCVIRVVIGYTSPEASSHHLYWHDSFESFQTHICRVSSCQFEKKMRDRARKEAKRKPILTSIVSDVGRPLVRLFGAKKKKKHKNKKKNNQSKDEDSDDDAGVGGESSDEDGSSSSSSSGSEVGSSSSDEHDEQEEQEEA